MNAKIQGMDSGSFLSILTFNVVMGNNLKQAMLPQGYGNRAYRRETLNDEGCPCLLIW